MHKSFFSRFFRLCYSLLAASLMIMGAVHIFLSVETYQRDTKEQLVTDTSEAVQYLQARLMSLSAEEINSYEMTGRSYLNNLTYHTQCEYYVADWTGKIAFCSDGIAEYADRLVPDDVLRSFDENGEYSFGTMSGFFDTSCFNLGYSLLKTEFGSYYLIGMKSADNMKAYMLNLLASMLICSVIILLLSYPLIYYSLMNVVEPINEMTIAAKRFGAGDFSEKVTVRDATEMGYLGNTLNDMAASLEKIEEDRKSFVSNVSHELKTPMTTIGGFVDGILDGTIPKNQHRYYLRIVSDEVDRLARLVRSMLNISKYESGEVSLQTENFEASALIFETALLFEKRIDDKKVNMEGLDSERFYLKADIDLTQQVIYNLTENAVKFVNEGGTIAFSHEVRGDYTSVFIRNSGEGLKENEISRVFDRFYKTDESRGKDKTGVGLGLSIVSSIIKLHGGKIIVRSKPREYTEFEFTLPTGTSHSGKKGAEQ